MGQEQVDEWSNRFAEQHYVPISDKEYGAIPREVRGRERGSDCQKVVNASLTRAKLPDLCM